MLKQLSKPKKILLIVTAVLLLIACIFITLLVTAESAVLGVWRNKDTSVSGTYITFALLEDGTYIEVITNADSGRVVKTIYGTWTISGFEVCLIDTKNQVVPFTYNPFTGILNNGGFWVNEANRDIPFVRVG